MTDKCRLSKNLFLSLFAIMFLVFWFAVNIGGTLWTGSVKFDATALKKYTLTTETLNWLRKNNRHIYIKLYVSDNLKDDFPLVAQNIRHIVFLLEQYKRLSHHMIQLEIVPVKPFSVSEKEAEKQGIRPFTDDNKRQNFFAGAVIGNDIGDSVTIPYFEPQRQHYLEHDITRIMSGLTGYTPKKIAVISPVLPVIKTNQNLSFSQDWDFIRQLRSDYDVDYLPPELVQIPLKYDLVILINPQNMEEISQYALDQYLLYGGNVMIFMDPFSEMSLALYGTTLDNGSNLKKFLASKGILYDEKQISGDLSLGMDALISQTDNGKVYGYPLWMDVRPPYINPQMPAMKDIRQLVVKSSGSFLIENPGNNRFTILYTTGNNGGEIDGATAKHSTKTFIKEVFEGQNKRQKLGVLVEGRFTSLVDRHPLENSPLIQKYRPFLSSSVKPGKLMVLGDSDMLANHNWNAAPLSTKQSIYDFIPYNNNMDFVERMVDVMTGNRDLLSPIPQTFDGGQPLETVINKKIWEKYQNEYDSQRLILQQQKDELELIEQQLSHQLSVPSVAISQKTTLLSHNIAAVQDKQNELLFKIDKEKQSIKRNIIILNIVVFPVLNLIIIGAVVFLFRRHKKQKAKEYADD